MSRFWISHGCRIHCDDHFRPRRRASLDVQSWPGDIDLIPCSAWSKTGDGGWVLTGGSIKLGSETMSNIGVKGDAAAHQLDRECGAKKK